MSLTKNDVFRKLFFYKNLFLIFVFLFFSQNIFAAPATITFQARIVKPDSTNLEASNVFFRFYYIYPKPVGTDNQCVIYVEEISGVNMTGSKGLVTLQMGTGTRTYGSGDLKNVFDNSTASYACQAGGTYTPAASDNRRVIIQFDDGSGVQTLPPSELTSVPFAMQSYNSQRLGNSLPTDFLKFTDFSGSCAPGEYVTYDSAGSPKFTCATPVTTAGTVTSVASGGAPIVVGGTATDPTISITKATGAVSGYLSSADWTTFNSKLSNFTTMSSSDVTTALGYTPLNSAGAVTSVVGRTGAVTLSSGDITGLAFGTTTGTYAQGNDSRFTDTRTPTDNSVTSIKIVDGTITSADISAGAITFNKLNQSSATPGQVIKWDGAAWVASSDASLVSSDISTALGYTAANSADVSAKVSKAGDTMTGPLVNNTNSASTAVAVTQSGVGHAATFMGGKVGIGTNTPTSLLHIVGGGHYDEGLTLQYSGSGSAWNMTQGLNSNLYLGYGVGNGSTDIMLIDTSGKVGIGTTTPGYKLDVAGDVNVTGNFKVNGVNIASGTVNSVTSGGAPIVMGGTSADPTVSITKATAAVNGYLSSSDWTTFNSKLSDFATMVSADITTALGYTAADSADVSGKVSKAGDTMTGSLNLPSNGLVVGTDQLVVNGGKIGIGTNAPTYKIDAVTTGQLGMRMTTVNSTISQPIFSFNDTGRSVEGLFASFDGVTNGFAINTWTASPLLLGTNQATHMTIDTVGQVGIGVTNPSYALQVSGDISVSGNFKVNGVNIASGTVNSVTSGGAPIVMGGTSADPTVSITKATAAVDGYLSSSDWTTFNSKLSDFTSMLSSDITTALGYTAANSADVSGKVSKAGDTMTGPLVNNTNSASTAVAVTQSGAGYAATFMGGNVGIGTTSPESKLHIIAGSAGTNFGSQSGKGIRLNSINGVSEAFWPYVATGAQLSNGGKNSASGTFGGIFSMLGVNAEYDTVSDTIGKPINVNFNSMDFNTSLSMAFISDSSATLGARISFFTAPTSNWTATEKMIILAENGNVGIGKSNPSYKLDVAGDVNITGNFKVNGVNISTGSGTVTSVTSGGAPIVMGGTSADPTISITKATAAVNGYLSSSDWTTFNSKLSDFTSMLSSDITTALGFTPLKPANNLSDVASADASLNNLLPAQSSSSVLQSNGTNTSWLGFNTTASNNTLVQRDGSGVMTANGIGLTNTGTVTLSAGAVSGTYSLVLPGAQGGNNQVMANNGSGALSWITPLTNFSTLTSSDVTTALGYTAANSSDVSAKVSKAGDTMTGVLNISASSASADLSVTQSGAGPAATFMGGNVGIGTTTPAQFFEVRKDQAALPTIAKVINSNATAGTQARYDLATGTPNAYAAMAVTETGAGTATFELGSGDGVTNGIYIYSGMTLNNRPIVFMQGPDERMRIGSSGNVGIGTSSPSSVTKLDVSGTVRVMASVETAEAETNSTATYSVPDVSKNVRRLTLNANTTITLPVVGATIPADSTYTLTIRLKQDGTGSRTVAWGAGAGQTIKWDSGAAPTIASGAAQDTIVQFTFIGGETVWYGSMVWREN